MEKPTNYTPIVSLIDQFNHYAQETQQTDLLGFAHWLIQSQTPTEVICPFTDPEKSATQQLGYLFGRISRFGRIYFKKSFEGSPIHSFEEFGFLLGILALGSPSKSELIHYCLLEVTTGSEIIRRLIKSNLVQESPDLNDKRAKQLAVSPQGMEAIYAATKKMQLVSDATFGALSDTERDQLSKLFAHLDCVHTHVYQNCRESEIYELIARIKTN